MNVSVYQQSPYLKSCGVSDEKLAKLGLDWATLTEIAEHHRSRSGELRDAAEFISKRLAELSQVHSLKTRVKDPEHLISKLVRKRADDKNFDVSLTGYVNSVTDLAGVRVLHLFKEQWEAIHSFVKSGWDLAETPIAYIREGDDEETTSGFRDAECDVVTHPFGYRSVHYLLRSQLSKTSHVTELQVRTLFEEGWSEIDHTVRYPNVSGDPLLAELLTIFNRLAGSADEMGSFIKALSSFLVEHQGEANAHARREAELEQEIRGLIKKLKVESKEKDELLEKVNELGRVLPPTIGIGPRTWVSPFSSSIAANSLVPSNASRLFRSAPRKCQQCGKVLSPVRIVAFDDGLCDDCRYRST